MRYSSSKPIFFIIVILSAALYGGWAMTTAGAVTAPRPVAAGAASLVASPLITDLPLAQLFKLTPRDGAANDSFGNSVAAGGDTIVIGAHSDAVGTKAQQGSAYVYVKSGGEWIWQQKLTANDGEAQDRFGESVAISGDTIVVGAPHDKTGANSSQGSAYVFVRSGGVWSFQQKLTAHDGEAGDQFGASVAVSGNTVVAGAFADNVGNNSDQGSASVFVRSSGAWSFQQKLIANDGQANDQFGASVAISGETVVVGALLDDVGTNSNQGTAYVFTRSSHAWSIQQKLTAQDGAAVDLFGRAVAISGDTVVVGAPLDDAGTIPDQGSAYVFTRSGTVWAQQPKLTANDGAASDQFGSSVAINGNAALIGAYFDDRGALLDQGSAYLFTRAAVGWAPRQKLTPNGGVVRELFGQTVALNGETAVVGSPHYGVGDYLSQGAIYIFGCGYIEQQPFTGSGAQAFDGFSHALAVDGDTAVVGVPFDDVGTNANQGSAYVFVRNGAGWTQAEQLFAFDGVANDRFGYSVAISGDVIVVGAPYTSVHGKLNQGAAYIFARANGRWTLKGRPFGDPTGGLYGWSVAAGGSLIAIGAPSDDVGVNENQGSVTLFNLATSGTTGSLEGVVTANDGVAFDNFGFSVSLSGDKLLVGAPGPNADERSKGAAYVFERSTAQSPLWKQRAKLLADDGQPLDRLGNSVALSGNTALVGAPGKVVNNPLRRQVAYVFVAPSDPGGAWLQQARLVLGYGYGYGSISVALSGNTAVIGVGSEYVADRYNQGMVYVFTRSGREWSPKQQIIAGDGRVGDGFGVSVGVSGDTILGGTAQAGGNNQGLVYVLKNSCMTQVQAITSVSAASFAASGGFAPESIIAGFGVNLATGVQIASSLPLPTTLAGVSLKVKDSAGVERPAPLFFVSPGQINYQIPPGTAGGPITVTVTNAEGPVASGDAQIANVAPGLFTANSTGQGVANAFALRVKANGSQSIEPVARFDSSQNRFVPAPIDLGPAGDQVFLVLYGTGLRYRSSLSAVSCAIGGAGSDVLFVGAAPNFSGLDQVNIRLPRSLAGRGELDVALSVDGKAANPVRVSIR